MRFSILPQEEKFFEDFKEQANLIRDGARALREMCEDWSTLEANHQRIIDREHESDEIVHQVALRLNKTFVTPVDREDIHALASSLDDILDYIHGTAVRMKLFKVSEPTPQSVELSRILEKATEMIQKGVELLPTFKDISSMRQDMKKLEKEGDSVYRTALADLFDNNTDALFVIKWKELYENIETAIDRCEDVFDVLEGVVVKHA